MMHKHLKHLGILALCSVISGYFSCF